MSDIAVKASTLVKQTASSGTYTDPVTQTNVAH